MSDPEVDPQVAFLLKRVELERENFKLERDRYENEVAQYAAAIRQLKSEVYVTQVKNSDLEILHGDVHKLKAIAAEYEALGGASLMDRFQELVSKCRSLEMDNGILQAFHEKDQARIVQLDAHNSELARKLSNMDDYHQIKRDLAAANAKLSQLTGDSNSHDAVVSSLHEDFLRLQREHSSLQMELLMERKKSERLMVAVEVLELDLKRSDQSVNSLAPDLEILKFEAEGYKQKAADAVIRADNELWLHEETRSHLQRIESTATQLEVHIGVLALQCETLQESLDKAHSENKSLQEQLGSRTQALEQMVIERESLMLELADVYAIGSVQEVIQKAQDTTAAQLELSNLRVSFHELEAEHEDALRKIMEDAQVRFQQSARRPAATKPPS